MANTRDRTILRNLVGRYLDACAKDVQAERRNLWRRHNSLKPTRPLIYVRAFAWGEMPEAACACEDPFFRSHENELRRRLFWDTLDDDSVFEPWLTVRAACITPPDGVWGLPVRWSDYANPRGSRVWDPPIKEPEDAAKMASPHHVVDEEQTAERAAKLSDAVGDLIRVCVDRAPAYTTWNGDISTQLAYLRGLEQVMLDMVDRPEWLHRLLAFMRDGIIRTHEEAERAGDWRLCDHVNQAMPYAEELSDPAPDGQSVKRRDLWYFCASQETTLVGPQMFGEFMLDYQLPIMEQFGLVAYGCCEDLTRKIGLLRRMQNLRRIAVAPAADVRKCAEQIGTDYVLSYRPNPAEMVSCGFDPDHVRTVLRRDLESCRGTHVDITLKDVETVEHDPERVRVWVKIAREVIEDVG